MTAVLNALAASPMDRILIADLSVESGYEHRFIPIPYEGNSSVSIPVHLPPNRTSVTHTSVGPKGDGKVMSFPHAHKPVELLSAPAIVCVRDEGTYMSVSVVGSGTVTLTVYELPYHADSTDALSILLTPVERMNLEVTYVLSKRTMGLFERDIVFLVTNLRPFCNHCAVAHTVTGDSDQDSTQDPSENRSGGHEFDPLYLQFFTPPLHGNHLNSTIIAPMCLHNDLKNASARVRIKCHSYRSDAQFTDSLRSQEIRTLESYSVETSRALKDKLLNIKSLLSSTAHAGTMSIHVQNALSDVERGWGGTVGMCGEFLVANIRNCNIASMSNEGSGEYLRSSSHQHSNCSSSRGVISSLHSKHNPTTLHQINIAGLQYPQRSSNPLHLGGVTYEQDGPYGRLSCLHYCGDVYLETMSRFISEMDATHLKSVLFLTVYVSHPLVPHMRRNNPLSSKVPVSGAINRKGKKGAHNRWTADKSQSHLQKCNTLLSALLRWKSLTPHRDCIVISILTIDHAVCASISRVDSSAYVSQGSLSPWGYYGALSVSIRQVFLPAASTFTSAPSDVCVHSRPDSTERSVTDAYLFPAGECVIDGGRMKVQITDIGVTTRHLSLLQKPQGMSILGNGIGDQDVPICSSSSTPTPTSPSLLIGPSVKPSNHPKPLSNCKKNSTLQPPPPPLSTSEEFRRSDNYAEDLVYVLEVARTYDCPLPAVPILPRVKVPRVPNEIRHVRALQRVHCFTLH